MYKESMNAHTVLFKGKQFCKAFDLTYLNENYEQISSQLQQVDEIYYKYRKSRSCWMNFKNALLRPENKDLLFSERIILGATNDKLSADLKEIPETEYIDKAGYKFTIGPRDGMDSISDLRQLSSTLKINIGKKLMLADPDVKEDRNKIVVNFRTDIINSLITFNGLFEPYEKYKAGSFSVTYYEDLTKDVNGDYNFVFPRKEPYDFNDEKNPIRLDWCNIVPYSWKDIEIVKRLDSIGRKGEWFEFEEEIGSDCLLFYNKVMYFFETNPHDPNCVRILDLDIGNINNFVKEDVFVVKFRDVNGKQLKQQRLVGFYNISDKVVYFPSDISNAIITYNGNYHEYIIRPDKKSIVFKIPKDINMYFDPDLNTKSRIYAVNFYTGTLDGRSFYQMPNAELSKIANGLLEEYKSKLDLSEQHNRELERIITDETGKEIIYSGYEEILSPIDDKLNYPNYQVFVLKFRPIEGTLKLFINGVYYNKDIFYTYDPNNKKIIWTYGVNDTFNGFDITPEMIVTVKYDIYYKDNTDLIKDIEAFKQANK